MTISAETVAHLSQTFLTGEAQHRPLTHIAPRYPDITEADCYTIQRTIVAALQTNGYTLVGRKCGFTSEASQASFGLAEPAYGHLLSLHQAAPGQPLDLSITLTPKLECEIAFIMGQSIEEPNVTSHTVAQAVAAVAPAFEVVDFRSDGTPPTKFEALAYNVFARYFVVGEPRVSVEATDWEAERVILKKNGAPLVEGSGAAVLGHPLDSLTWLVNKLSAAGHPLQAGEVVITGTMTPLQDVISGDKFEATFDTLGTLSVAFSGGS